MEFSDLGVHQDFQKPEFFMPELLLKRTMYKTYHASNQIGISEMVEEVGRRKKT